VDTHLLQETLRRLIRTEQVRLREADGEIRLTPVMSVESERTESDCPLLGLLVDYKDYTLDNFLARKHADKALDL
jgi:hypothetical protein